MYDIIFARHHGMGASLHVSFPNQLMVISASTLHLHTLFFGSFGLTILFLFFLSLPLLGSHGHIQHTLFDICTHWGPRSGGMSAHPGYYATAVKYMAGFGMGKQDLPKLLAGKVDEWLQKASKDEKAEKPVAAKKRKTEKKEKKDGQAKRAKK